MKEKNFVALYKSGNFYNAYGDDAVILHHLLGYKYDPHKKSVGFPVVALAKVKVALESKKLAYKIYEKDQVIEETKGIIKEYKASIKEGLKKLDMEERLKNLNDKLDNFSLEDLEKVVEEIEDARLNKKWKVFNCQDN